MLLFSENPTPWTAYVYGRCNLHVEYLSVSWFQCYNVTWYYYSYPLWTVLYLIILRSLRYMVNVTWVYTCIITSNDHTKYIHSGHNTGSIVLTFNAVLFINRPGAAIYQQEKAPWHCYKPFNNLYAMGRNVLQHAQAYIPLSFHQQRATS